MENFYFKLLKKITLILTILIVILLSFQPKQAFAFGNNEFHVTVNSEGCVEIKFIICDKNAQWCGLFSVWGRMVGHHTEPTMQSKVECTSGGLFKVYFSHDGGPGWTRFLDPWNILSLHNIYVYYFPTFGSFSVSYADEDNKIWAILTWQDVTTGSKTLELKSHFAFADCSWSEYNASKPVTVPQIADPTSFDASDGTKCDRVDISWTPPSAPNGITQDVYTILYRDGHPLGTFLNSTTSYSDYGASIDGTEHTYELISYWNNCAGIRRYSNKLFTTGHRKTTPLAPISISATDDVCDKITIDWVTDGAGETPDKFEIKMYDAANTLVHTKTNIAGTSTDIAFADAGFSYFTNYRCEMLAHNECGWGAESSQSENGMFYGTPPAPTAVTIIPDNSTGKIKIDWTQTDATHVDEYLVRRTLVGGTDPAIYTVDDPLITEYTDETPEMCITYKYEVFARNYCNNPNEGISGGSGTAYIGPDLSNTFPPGSFNGYKGYSPTRVLLNWSPNNKGSIDQYTIKRKIAGTTDEMDLAILTPPAQIYIDEIAEAGILYEYTIQAEGDCEGNTIQSNIASCIGFRTAAGTVNGRISYGNGTPVQGVKVMANLQSGAIPGKSLQLDGSQKITVPRNAGLESNHFTIEGWVKIDPASSAGYLINRTNAIAVYYNGAEFDFHVNNGTVWASTLATVPKDEWFHYACTYDGSDIKIYINGVFISLAPLTGNVYYSTLSDYIIGNGMIVGIDELKMWTIARTADDIAADYNRILAPDVPGLAAYWRINENYGNYIYDCSKQNGIYNKNNGELTADNLWSDDFPSQNKLGMIAYTDVNGNYSLPYIPYTGTGENYIITPVFGVHQFEPLQQILFIGEGSQVHNNINFEDISSFTVTGTVYYQTVDDAGNEALIPARDIMLKVDNQYAMTPDNQIVKTAADGSFEVQVPIGEHSVSIDKPYHSFKTGRFPPTGTYNFQDELHGIEFRDTTHFTIIGKVVGGQVEADKKHGFGYTKNNIGSAELSFQPIGQTLVRHVQTDAVNAEYSIRVLPVKYQVEVDMLTHPTIEFDNKTVDFSSYFQTKTDYDTTWIDKVNNIYEVDSVNYNHKLDYVHRSEPVIEVLNAADSTQFSGQDSVKYIPPVENPEPIWIKTNPSPFPYPVFQQGSSFYTRIFVQEQYRNFDSDPAGVLDYVPVRDVRITIENDLTAQKFASKVFDLNSADIHNNGDTLYFFKIAYPDFTADAGDFSFSKAFNVTAQVGNKTVQWLPRAGSTPEERVFRGIILGSKNIEGSNFYTEGPELVDMILRDPPGTNSYSYFSKDSTYAVTRNVNINLGNETTLGGDTEFGMDTWIDCGPGAPEIKQKNGVKIMAEVAIQAEFEWNNSWSESYSFSQTISTSEASDYVGSKGDLFVGSSRNYTYGLTNMLQLYTQEQCDMASVECYDTYTINHEGTDYKLGKTNGFRVDPEGFGTMFVYSQNHIENYLIPNLMDLRNEIFVTQPSKYISRLTAEDPNYGKSNDDAAFGGDEKNFTLYTYSDSGGEWDKQTESYTVAPDVNSVNSYVFIRATNNDTDKVWYYNQQIRLWEEALAFNEKQKLEAETYPGLSNVSFDAASIFEQSVTTSKAHEHSFSFTVGLAVSAGLEIVNNTFGNGFNLNASTTINTAYSNEDATETEVATTYGFVLADEDQGDYYTVDVKQSAGSPVFYVKGGQSSCPYIGPEVTKYYEPGTPLGDGTIRREEPLIEITPTVQYNVPSDEVANFTVLLKNESPSGDDMQYQLEVDEASNPDGLILQIDGESPNRPFYVPAGGVVEKTLTVRMTKHNITDYENIKLIFHSICQYAAGTSDGEDIADEATFSVHFIPACSDVELSRPEDEWTANFGNNDTIDILIDNYNINYPTLEKINLQAKKSNQGETAWSSIAEFWLDTGGDPNKLPIPTDNSFIAYPWDIAQYNDDLYDLRATAVCSDNVKENSPTHNGIIDRVNPHPFGNPQPADGVLSPNDEIMIQFNEQVNAGYLNNLNFEISGVLNGSDLYHGAAVSFDGANDYLEIANGINLTNTSFTVEFWVRRSGTGEECIISQGFDNQNGFYISFNSSDELTFSLAGQTVSTGVAQASGVWAHYACSYNKTTNTIEIYRDAVNLITQSFTSNYTGNGKIFVAKCCFDTENWFNGELHELRIWNTTRSLTQIAPYIMRSLSGKETGLIGYWQLQEAFGNLAKDKAHSRHAIVNAEWKVEPAGKGSTFNGTTDYLTAPSPAFSNEMDFTIEFWFKSGNGNQVCLLSNGKGDGTDGNASGWAIYTNAEGKIQVSNNGYAVTAVNQNMFDDNWHHFAMSYNHLGNTNFYIDGELQSSFQNLNWKNGFGGSKLWIGARGYFADAIETTDMYFSGSLDDIRIWNLARRHTQIENQMTSRLSGNEIGIVSYYPFEFYTEVMNVWILTETLANQVDGSTQIAVFQGSATYTDAAPPLKLERPVQSIPYNFSVNDDKIILTPDVDAGMIENCILDITVKDVYDLNGNVLQSPVTWTAFVNKNQVNWIESEIILTKKLYEPLSFQATIQNSGGNIESFTIDGLPDWLTASPSYGNLQPLSDKTITFSIDESLNIGHYSPEILLNTDFNYAEKLPFDLRVFASPPDWSVNPENYQYSMSLIGQVLIDNVISSDPFDRVAAFVNGECRGVAQLQYLEDYDMYEVFLDIYSNVENGEVVELVVWDASQDAILTKVTPAISFAANTAIGKPRQPKMIYASNEKMVKVPLPKGWKWLSFNIQSAQLSSVNEALSSLSPTNGDIIKSRSAFDQYDAATGWTGSLTYGGGLTNHQLYMLKLAKPDTLLLQGSPVETQSAVIPINQNWNWLSYLPQVNIDVNTALSGFTSVTQDDIIKSQTAFAMYDANMGWLGSLQYMKPNEGYMLKAQNAGTLTYPETGMYRHSSDNENDPLQSAPAEWQYNQRDYPQNMTLLAVVETGDILQTSDNDMIAAFVNNECRGVAKSVKYKDGLLFFMTIQGNENTENVRFAYLNSAENRIYPVKENVQYLTNRTIGDLPKPFALTLALAHEASHVTLEMNHEMICSVFPNPFESSVQIHFVIHKPTDVNIAVYNVLGKKINTLHNRNLPAGSYQIEWNGSSDTGDEVKNGIYFIELSTENDKKVFKVVKFD